MRGVDYGHLLHVSTTCWYWARAPHGASSRAHHQGRRPLWLGDEQQGIQGLEEPKAPQHEPEAREVEELLVQTTYLAAKFGHCHMLKKRSISLIWRLVKRKWFWWPRCLWRILATPASEVFSSFGSSSKEESGWLLLSLTLASLSSVSHTLSWPWLLSLILKYRWPMWPPLWPPSASMAPAEVEATTPFSKSISS